MMFLLIFNVAISITGTLHIYNLDTEGGLPQNATAEDLQDSGGGLWIFLGQSLTALIVGALAGAVGGYYLLRVPTAEGAAYGFFGTFIVLIFTNTIRVLWSIVAWVPSEFQGGVAIVVGLFLGLSGLLCALGFLQMIRGGFATYL
jgi:hypothetical protein